jgi:hypothetical protein
MRHASIQTTMNVYGRVMTDSKRQAQSTVVQMVLKAESKETAEENCEPHAAKQARRTESLSQPFLRL